MSSSEIARKFGIPLRRKFGKTEGYGISNAYRSKAEAQRQAKKLRSERKYARVVPVTLHPPLERHLSGKDEQWYVVYYRPKHGWSG